MLALLVLSVTVVTEAQASVTGSAIEQWWGGFKLQFTITPTSSVDSWCFNVQLSGNIDNVEVILKLAKY
jgi:hypothetical protein